MKQRTQISAEVIQASVGPNGIPIYTLRLVYPRFIHSEFMTHRLFSRNAASSRAIPIKKMVEQVENDPAKPVHWGINQPGMQAENILSPEEAIDAEKWWEFVGLAVAEDVRSCQYPLHKQVLNRLLEPWQWMVVIVTATDWNNFFHLRCHKDAQPEIKVLAELVKKAIEESVPFQLDAGEYHVPFVERVREEDGLKYLLPPDDEGYQFYCTPADAVKVSASVCAQTSFRAMDYSLDKALAIYDRLVESKPVHASPFEHQAIALSDDDCLKFNTHANRMVSFDWPRGITHMDRDFNLWSGNFRGWIQNRQLINEHEVKG